MRLSLAFGRAAAVKLRGERRESSTSPSTAMGARRGLLLLWRGENSPNFLLVPDSISTVCTFTSGAAPLGMPKRFPSGKDKDETDRGMLSLENWSSACGGGITGRTPCAGVLRGEHSPDRLLKVWSMSLLPDSCHRFQYIDLELRSSPSAGMG